LLHRTLFVIPQGSAVAVAFAVACSFVCHPRDLLLLLPLPLPVPLFVIPQGSAVAVAFAVACSFVCHPAGI
jgi:hypothetical protein